MSSYYRYPLNQRPRAERVANVMWRYYAAFIEYLGKGRASKALTPSAERRAWLILLPKCLRVVLVISSMCLGSWSNCDLRLHCIFMVRKTWSTKPATEWRHAGGFERDLSKPYSTILDAAVLATNVLAERRCTAVLKSPGWRCHEPKVEGRSEGDVQATTGIGSAENATVVARQDVPCSTAFRQDPLPLLAAFASPIGTWQQHEDRATCSMLHAPCGKRTGKAEV